MPATLVEKYGRKSLSRSSARMPGPVSLTTMRTRPVSAQVLRLHHDLAAAAPTASTALSTRFSTARLM